jgi:predicted DNA-binding transcriptional regulator YafY
VERLLRGSFGVVEGGKARRVVLRFDAWAARLVTERAWHPSQRVRPVRGGGAEVEFRLGSLFEVERWILGWAGHVEVRFPAELRRRVGQAGLALGRANGAPAGSRR